MAVKNICVINNVNDNTHIVTLSKALLDVNIMHLGNFINSDTLPRYAADMGVGIVNLNVSDGVILLRFAELPRFAAEKKLNRRKTFGKKSRQRKITPDM